MGPAKAPGQWTLGAELLRKATKYRGTPLYILLETFAITSLS